MSKQPAIPLPPIHFFPLQRAAELTGCTTEDILQMAYTGAIDLCVLVRDCHAILSLHGDLSEWGGDHECAFNDIIPDRSEFFNVYGTRVNGEMVIKQPKLQAPKAIGDRILTEDERISYAKGMESALSNQLMEFNSKISGFWLLPRYISIDLFINKKADSVMPLRPIFNPPQDIHITAIPARLSNDDGNISLSARVLNINSGDVFITREDVKKITETISQDKTMAIHGLSDIHELSNVEEPHHSAERFATNREDLLKAAIHILSKYPDECRGSKKEISPEKWCEALLKHHKEVPPLMITNEETIKKKLREAVNLKWVSNPTVGVQ